ncbi:MAG: NfeD family protein [Clostridium sp.]|nr:NfeD family protein [Clostridium sp.]MCM1170874.1 NfeD family protein [Clostridium sp.]MCM1209244.1 NfeD family protein [Ruminococcus sp.]
MIVVWLVVSAVLIIAEIVSLGLTTIWFALGALAAALAAFLGANVSIQLIVFAVLSFVFLIFTAPVARKHFMRQPEKTNVEGLVGMIGVVTDAIDNLKSEGTVFLNGQEWSARSESGESIEKDCRVSVVSISGVKLIVKREA